MKSLEIVNRNIKSIKKLLRNLQNAKEGTQEDFDKYYHEQELKEQTTIKQDLERKGKLEEVIEIIRPIICLGENIEEGGNEYWLASDRRLFHLTKEQYELINEVLSK